MTRAFEPPLLAALLLACFAGCREPAASDRVLATYPGGEITESEWRASSSSRGTNPDAASMLRRLALVESLAESAVAVGGTLPSELALKLQQLEDRPWVAALEAKVRSEQEPTEAQIEAYLDEHRRQLQQPTKLRLWNLFKRAPEADSAARDRVRRVMEGLKSRLDAGEDFNDLAREESEAVNRFRGGRMGAVPAGRLRREVDAVAFALAEGETSPVIAVPDGFVILRNAGVVEARTMSEREARQRIRNAMRRWNFDAEWAALRAELLTAAELASPEAIANAGRDTVIGTVAGVDLTYADIESLAGSGSSAPSAARQTPTPHRLAAVLEEHAMRRLAAERARSDGLLRAPDQVARSVARRNRLLAEAELERRALAQPVAVTEAEVRDFFDSHPRLFQVPRLHDLSVIQLRLDSEPETLRDKTVLGRRTHDRIRAGEISFADAAREVSEHPSAGQGGRIGPKPRRWAATLGPNVLDAFDRLEPGGMTGLIRQDDLWLLRLERVTEGRSLSFEEAREQARWGVEQQNLRARIAGLERNLAANFDPQVEILELPEVAATTKPGGRPPAARLHTPDAASSEPPAATDG